jgi:hypothetical protein
VRRYWLCWPEPQLGNFLSVPHSKAPLAIVFGNKKSRPRSLALIKIKHVPWRIDSYLGEQHGRE